MSMSTINRAVERATREVQLSRFKRGVADGLFRGVADDSDLAVHLANDSEFYYKNGYDFGVSLYCELEEDQ